MSDECLSEYGRIRFQEELGDARSAYKDFAILCPERRDELAEHLSRAGVQTKKYFVPLHTMPAYARFRRPDDDLGDTEETARTVLCLPMFNELDEADVERVSRSILDFYGTGG